MNNRYIIYRHLDGLILSNKFKGTHNDWRSVHVQFQNNHNFYTCCHDRLLVVASFIFSQSMVVPF